jgi:uncharacterized membrane protein YkvI
MPRIPRAGAHVLSTRPVHSSAHLHIRIIFARFVAAVVSVTGATCITQLMWGLPSQVDALLAVTSAAGWCLWLERHDHQEPW